jgi:hypothetical protein
LLTFMLNISLKIAVRLLLMNGRVFIRLCWRFSTEKLSLVYQLV